MLIEDLFTLIVVVAIPLGVARFAWIAGRDSGFSSGLVDGRKIVRETVKDMQKVEGARTEVTKELLDKYFRDH